jgi:hypothetical protein
VAMYLLPTGPIHRILATLGEHGRSVPLPPGIVPSAPVDAVPAVEQAAIDISWIVAVSDDGNDVMAGVRAVLTGLVRAAEQRGAEKAAQRIDRERRDAEQAPPPKSKPYLAGLLYAYDRAAKVARALDGSR